MTHNWEQIPIRPDVRDGSFATGAFRASAGQCPLCAESDDSRHESELTRCAISGLMQRSKSRHSAIHSITSSARASSDGGTVRPSALAVLRLKINSNLVGNMTCL